MKSHTPHGRLAPSPTGAQHVGNARTYLIAWLAARSAGGTVALRMEDLDGPRIKKGAAEQALNDLRWLGLDWDGEPIVQSTRMAHYAAALESLKAKNLVYPCTCTRSDVAAAASAPHAGDEGPAYPGTCSYRLATDVPTDRPYCWRFRVSDSPAFVDDYRGPIAIDLKQQGGDFVVWKTDGTPAYQLSVVVDDAAMGVTQVIRGDDLIPSTPRQMLMYEALGLVPPTFAHVPLVVGTDGRRLAKRHGDTRLSTLRAARVKPEILVGLLARSCGWRNEREPATPRELIANFEWKTIPREPFVLTDELLAGIGYLLP
jgi:glutamyl-tRNA synthetase